MMKFNCIAIFLSVALLLACSSCAEKKKKKAVYNAIEKYDDDIYAKSGDEIRVPYTEIGGVKYVNVRVNGIPFEMIFDTGCSNALISISKFNYLKSKGLISKNDILGKGKSQIADGSIVEETIVNLSEVVIDDQLLCTDIRAGVSENANAPLLLGNAVLDKFATVTIDTENNTLNFKVK